MLNAGKCTAHCLLWHCVSANHQQQCKLRKVTRRVLPYIVDGQRLRCVSWRITNLMFSRGIITSARMFGTAGDNNRGRWDETFCKTNWCAFHACVCCVLLSLMLIAYVHTYHSGWCCSVQSSKSLLCLCCPNMVMSSKSGRLSQCMHALYISESTGWTHHSLLMPSVCLAASQHDCDHHAGKMMLWSAIKKKPWFHQWMKLNKL